MGRRLTLILAVALLGVSAPDCAHPLSGVKVYYSRPDLGGIYRKQADELVPYQDTRAYRCVNPQDWEAILNLIEACKVR